MFVFVSDWQCILCVVSALPSLLDSEEEIMTTKYELSKMQ